MIKYYDFQHHPAQLYIFEEKQNKNKLLIELWEVFVNSPG